MDTSAYFPTRSSVGASFAKQLTDYSGQNNAVLALSPGGVAVGLEIAQSLHCLLGLLLLKHIYLPGENKPLGVVDSRGRLTYGQDIAHAFIEEFEMEYRATIEDKKMEAVSKLHAVGSDGQLVPTYFQDKNVIIVNDFTKTGTAYKAAMDFLKPVRTGKIILVTAIAQLPAVDVMHLMGDKILIEHATDKDLPPDHYFEEGNPPMTPELKILLSQVPMKW